MTAPMPAAQSVVVPAGRLVQDITCRYRLKTNSTLLDVGGGQGEVVARFRARGITAFGLYDGAAPPRDPYAVQPKQVEIQERQPAVLHQGVPFPAHSFECVLLRETETYAGSLLSPEACTATANLLASLKPGGALVWCVPVPRDELAAHLSAFPGRSQSIEIGTGGIGGTLMRLVGIGRDVGQAAVEFTLPTEPISRLDWHRMARQAVMAARSSAA